MTESFDINILKKGDLSKKITKKPEAQNGKNIQMEVVGDQLDISSDECKIHNDTEMKDQQKMLDEAVKNKNGKTLNKIIEAQTPNSDEKIVESPTKR